MSSSLLADRLSSLRTGGGLFASLSSFLVMRTWISSWESRDSTSLSAPVSIPVEESKVSMPATVLTASASPRTPVLRVEACDASSTGWPLGPACTAG